MYRRFFLVFLCFGVVSCSLNEIKMPRFTIHHDNQPSAERKITPSHPSDESESDQPTLTIIRNDEHPPSFSYSIRVDGDIIGMLKAEDKFVELPVAPGSHRLVCEKAAGSGIDRAETEFEIQAGESAYFEARLTYMPYFDAGELELLPLSDERGARMVDRIRDTM